MTSNKKYQNTVIDCPIRVPRSFQRTLEQLSTKGYLKYFQCDFENAHAHVHSMYIEIILDFQYTKACHGILEAENQTGYFPMPVPRVLATSSDRVREIESKIGYLLKKVSLEVDRQIGVFELHALQEIRRTSF